MCDDLLDRLEGDRWSGAAWTAPRPAHDDRDALLSVGRGDECRWLSASPRLSPVTTIEPRMPWQITLETQLAVTPSVTSVASVGFGVRLRRN